MTRPTVVISLDLELSWGSFDLGFDDNVRKMARWTHDVGAPNLLNISPATVFSATWAIVGAMMRRRFLTFRASRSPLSALLAPLVQLRSQDGDESTHPEWFGASLVDGSERNSGAEIGFHSFSHVPLRSAA